MTVITSGSEDRPERAVPPEVREAVRAFLNECQAEAQPLALNEVLGAIRRIFPALDVSDSDLMDAVSSEAATTGFDIDLDSVDGQAKLRRKALERWDNEGGAAAKPKRTEAERRISNDTSGARRRAKATKDRNQLI